MAARPVCVTDLDRWVLSNGVPDSFAFSKGFWDYVELVRRLSVKLDIYDVRVVGHYVIDTPPPQEQLPMPAVALTTPRVMVAIKWDFGASCRWPFEWTLSVRRHAPYRGPTFGLFDPACDLRRQVVPGLEPDLVFGPYGENQAEFSCEVEDAGDVATLLRMVFYEA